MIRYIKEYILKTGKKSVTVSPTCYHLTPGDVVRVFCGYCQIIRVINRKNGNRTLLLK